MNKIFKFFPVALAAIALASCSNDDLFEKNGSAAVGGKTTVAEIESFDAQTRSAFAEIDHQAKTRKLVWAAGDAYKQYGELATADRYELQAASAGKSSGTFDNKTVDYNDNPTIAIYPYSDANVLDRASKTLTINLPQAVNYGEIAVNDEGYEEAIGYVANAPMVGSYKDGAVSFLYLTALLKVDLSTLPKNTYALEITTDRPLYGNFDVDLSDISGDITASNCPSIESPVGDGSTYKLTVNTTPESKRTNKTFFIPVPTGNKYKVFDVKVWYRMGGTDKYETVAQLGNTARQTAGESILTWNRGKVKSLTRAITVTSGGNTPNAISAFLAEEHKNFPAGNDIVIEVTDASGAIASLQYGGTGEGDEIIIPADLKNRKIIINVDPSQNINAASPGQTLYIKDEDPAPVPGKSLRSIEICGNVNNSNKPLVIEAPETQVIISAPEGKAAKWKSITATTSNADNGEIGSGLVLGAGVDLAPAAADDVTVTVDGGGLLIEEGANVADGNSSKVVVNGDDPVVVKADANATFDLTGNSSISIQGKDKDNMITVKRINMAWVPGDANSKPSTGDIDVDFATVTYIYSETTGNVTFDNTGAVHILDSRASGAKSGTGNPAITVNNAASISDITIGNDAADKAISIDGVTGVVAKVLTDGKNAITMTNLEGDVTDVQANNENSAAKLSIASKSDKAITVTAITYKGQGDVEASATAGKEITVNTLNIPEASTDALKAKQTGKVTLTNLAAATTITKNTTGALTITGLTGNAATITNKAGAISISGSNADGKAPKVGTKLTQNGDGDITLTDLSVQAASQGVKEIALGANAIVANINYINTYIGEITGTTCTKDLATKVKGTKASALGKVLPTVTKRTFTAETDAWDGSYSKDVVSTIYTSASFAALTKATTSLTPTVYVDIDLNGKDFNDGTTGSGNPKWGITNITSLTGQKNGDGDPITKIKGLVTTTGLFRDLSATTTIENFIIENAKVTGKANAGVIVGTTAQNLTVTNVKVTGAEINTTKDYSGTAINFGGLVGSVTAGTTTISKVAMENNTIHGHYYLGGIIGAVGSATKVEIKQGTTTKGTTFDVQSGDGKWATAKSGTVAPFIGGVTGTLTDLVINDCGYDEPTQFTQWKYDMNFLADETYMYLGTIRPDTRFVGYVEGTINTYKLKLNTGFEASPSMSAWNATTKPAPKDTEYNVFVTSYASYQ